jgi:hypothetical protein
LISHGVILQLIDAKWVRGQGKTRVRMWRQRKAEGVLRGLVARHWRMRYIAAVWVLRRRTGGKNRIILLGDRLHWAESAYKIPQLCL